MDGAAIENIRMLTERGLTFELGKMTYSPVSLKPVYHDPRPDALTVSTLSGLRDYIKENVDGLSLDECLVIVNSFDLVSLVSRVTGESNKRHTIVQVELERVERFPFDKWMSPEEFNIRIRAQFIQTPNRDVITDFVSKIDIESGASLEDDGVSQSAMIKKKLHGHLGERKEAPVVLSLKPYRTFPEIDQPESEFLFRMREGNGMLQIALFEADGGAWRNQARESIYKWLTEQLEEEVPVIA